jgi:hypothetical protein
MQGRWQMIDWTLSKQRLGELLVERGVITEHQLERALIEPRRCGERLGETLLRLGFIDRRRLTLALVRQHVRAFLGALGVMAMTLHPELAIAAVARAQLGVSATVVGGAVADLRLLAAPADAPAGAVPGKVAVTLACSTGGGARIGIEGGHLAPGATAAFDYIRTWRSGVLKTLACGAAPRSVKVAIAGQSGGSTGSGMPAVNVTIDY